MAMLTVEYSEAREHVAALCDRVTEGRAPIPSIRDPALRQQIKSAPDWI